MDIKNFKQLLIKSQPHALVRYGEGEKNIFDQINCNRKGFKYDSIIDEEFRQDLIDSYHYRSANYYVGDKEPISACVFVNENYPIFISEIVPLFNMYPVLLVGHERSDLSSLPFKIKNFFAVSDNAWRYYPKLADNILVEIKSHQSPVLVLFACGPYSNVLVHKIWEEDKNNILWNIGSTIDPYIFGVNTRQYHERIFNAS